MKLGYLRMIRKPRDNQCNGSQHPLQDPKKARMSLSKFKVISLLFPTWYTILSVLQIIYASTCFGRHPPILRRSLLLIIQLCSLRRSHSLQVAVLCTCWKEKVSFQHVHKTATCREWQHQRLHNCIINNRDLLKMAVLCTCWREALQQVHKTATCREWQHQKLHNCIINNRDLLKIGGCRPKHVEA
jgi:hypothetical protein